MRQWLRRSGKLRFNVFWQFFLSFFVLVLVPSVIASLFTYIYVVKVIETEVEESSSILIGHFSEKTDELVDALRDDMIKLLSGIDPYLRYRNSGDSNPVRLELQHSLTTQISGLAHNHPLVHNAYLVHAAEDEVISSQGGRLSKQLFFQYLNDMSSPNNGDISGLFAGKKMMAFTNPLLIHQRNLYEERILSSETVVAAIMSYPFNSDHPTVYLAVNIDVDRLASQIAIRNADVIETAILNEDGYVLSYAGSNAIDGEELLHAYREAGGSPAHLTSSGRDLQVTYEYSDRHRWIYVSMSDLKELRQPAALIRQSSIALLLFFCFIGALLSYLFSKRMYSPIRDIKRGLEFNRRDRHTGNEFELIRQWSERLVSENKDMTQRIAGMSPIMHEYFLSKLLSGEFRDELSISIYAKEVGFDVKSSGKLAVLCISVEFYERLADLTETDRSFIIIDLKNDILKRLQGQVWLCQTRTDLLACIVHPADDGPQGAAQYARKLKHVLERYEGYFHSAIGVGKTVQQVGELHHSYTNALRLLKRKGMQVQVEICLDGASNEARQEIDGFLSSEKVKQMISLYQTGRHDLMLQRVNEMLDLAASNNASSETVKQLSVDILNTWLRAVVEDRREDFSIERHAVLLQRLKRCVTIGELRRFFEEAAGELFRNPQANVKVNDFEDIVQYIRQNYHQELGIEQFANQLSMSVGHFSRSFKEAVGEKYIDFITKCRMEAAKQLLVGTDMKIDDIAVQVGYLGRHSFIRIFSKSVGVTPGKYRQSRRAGE